MRAVSPGRHSTPIFLCGYRWLHAIRTSYSTTSMALCERLIGRLPESYNIAFRKNILKYLFTCVVLCVLGVVFVPVMFHMVLSLSSLVASDKSANSTTNYKCLCIGFCRKSIHTHSIKLNATSYWWGW